MSSHRPKAQVFTGGVRSGVHLGSRGGPGGAGTRYNPNAPYSRPGDPNSSFTRADPSRSGQFKGRSGVRGNPGRPVPPPPRPRNSGIGRAAIAGGAAVVAGAAATRSTISGPGVSGTSNPGAGVDYGLDTAPASFNSHPMAGNRPQTEATPNPADHPSRHPSEGVHEASLVPDIIVPFLEPFIPAQPPPAYVPQSFPHIRNVNTNVNQNQVTVVVGSGQVSGVNPTLQNSGQRNAGSHCGRMWAEAVLTPDPGEFMALNAADCLATQGNPTLG